MENQKISYCLLCANVKCFSELMLIESDEKDFYKIMDKLTRLNILYLGFKEILTKTVCLSCIDNLNKAYDFVMEVEKAQHDLKDLYENQIKREICSSDEDLTNELVNQSDYSLYIKQEFETQSTDNSSVVLGNLKENNQKLKKGKVAKQKSQILNPCSSKYLKLTWNDYLWTCAYCETQFSTIEELKIHSMQYHQCCNAFKCNDCNIRKLHLKQFIVHVKRHRKYLKLSCYRCNSKFTFPHELHVHMRVAHAPRTKFVCLGCCAEFQSSNELGEHNRTFNRDKRSRDIPIALQSVNSLACLICKKTFKTKGTLNTHLLIHTDRKREHTCEKCGKCFLNKQNLAGHMLMHDNVRPYQCEICKCSFKTSKQLKAHVAIHNGDKPHTCDQCGKGFRLQRQLNSHKIIHTDSLPYVCSYCNKRFRFKTILNQHLRQHTGIKPYSCDICKRDFTNWPNYNKHMKRRHSLDMAKKKRTPHGVYPINPSTGEIIKHEETSETLEWKNQILQRKHKGRPSSQHEENNTIKILNNEELEVNMNIH